MATLSPSIAARLNEEGASYHERGDDNSALAAFKDALESISADCLANAGASVSAMISPVPDPTAAVANSATAASTTTPAANAGSSTMTTTTNTTSTSSADRLQNSSSSSSTSSHPPGSSGDQLSVAPNVEEEETYVFDRCLSFEPEYANDPETASYCSAIIIFNMGLLYQKKGKDARTLYKALFLYMISLRHIRTGQNSNSNHQRFLKSDVVIAALNNQAMVLHMLKDYGKARIILGELWSHLRDIRCRPASFKKSDIDGIVQNILLLLHSPTLAAAA